MNWTKTTTKRIEKYLSFWIWCDLYQMRGLTACNCATVMHIVVAVLCFVQCLHTYLHFHFVYIRCYCMKSSLKNMCCSSNNIVSDFSFKTVVICYITNKSTVHKRKVPYYDKFVGISCTCNYHIDKSGRNSDDKINAMTIFLFNFVIIPNLTFMIDPFY